MLFSVRLPEFQAEEPKKGHPIVSGIVAGESMVT